MRTVFERGVGHAAAALPVNTLAPSIAGDPYIGETLTATPGVWDGADTVTGEWFVGGVATGDTDTSYTVLLADAGKPVEYRETAINGAGSVTQASNTISIGSLTAQVQALFANGEQGALYYLTEDFAGLYQDARGTTPVTAMEQPVGLMLDKSQGLVLGSELVSDPGFDSPGAWTPQDANWSVSGGKAAYNDTSLSYLQFTTATGVVAGKTYKVTIQFVNVMGSGGAAVIFALFNTAASYNYFGSYQQAPSAGTYTYYVTATGNDTGFRIYGNDGSTGPWAITSLSIKEVPGNHASQKTTAARPELRSGPLRIDYDGVDDYLRTVFPNLGSNCTIGRSVPGSGASILTGQTINGNSDNSTDFCALAIIDRALTGGETAYLTAWLNQQAGIA